WFLFKGLQVKLDTKILPAIVAGIAIGLIGEIFSKMAKEPVTVFIIVGILLLLPGDVMYRIMYNLLKENYDIYIYNSSDILLIEGAISINLLIATVFSKTLKISKNRLKKASLYKFENKNKFNK